MSLIKKPIPSARKVESSMKLNLPTAEELRDLQDQCPKRIAERAKDELIQQLMEDMVTHLVSKSGDLMKKAAAKGYGYTILTSWRAPSKDKEGQPLYKPEQTHWAGLDESGKPRDPSKDGVPLSMIFEGVLKPCKGGKPIAHPELLPGGKSVINLLNERLEKSGLAFHKAYDQSHGNSLTVIWKMDEWKKNLAVREKEQHEHVSYRPRRFRQEDKPSKVAEPVEYTGGFAQPVNVRVHTRVSIPSERSSRSSSDSEEEPERAVPEVRAAIPEVRAAIPEVRVAVPETPVKKLTPLPKKMVTLTKKPTKVADNWDDEDD